MTSEGILNTVGMREGFITYRRPAADPLTLAIAPRLESWDAKGAPSQLTLAAFLDHVDSLARPLLDSSSLPLAIELAVGTAGAGDLIAGGRDLDNFIYPIVRRLGHARFVSAWATKTSAVASTLRIEPAEPAPLEEPSSWSFSAVETSVSTSTSDWKHQIADRLTPPPKLAPPGPLELQIAYVVSARRNWSWVWKPTIDALRAILGTNNARSFHPRDDRIVQLALHRHVDNAMRDRVRVGIWWRGVG